MITVQDYLHSNDVLCTRMMKTILRLMMVKPLAFTICVATNTALIG